jgi:hypothetical protein
MVQLLAGRVGMQDRFEKRGHPLTRGRLGHGPADLGGGVMPRAGEKDPILEG